MTSWPKTNCPGGLFTCSFLVWRLGEMEGASIVVPGTFLLKLTFELAVQLLAHRSRAPGLLLGGT